nr:alpha/beta hydrolase [Acanthopleuribacter pedis]
MRFWPSQTPPRGLVCLVHGLGEHCGRYQHVAGFFNRAGYAVAALDLLGHGASVGRRGHFYGYPAVATQINAVVAEAAKSVGDLPVVLYGHSMGGNMVLNVLLRGLLQKEPEALVLSGPLFEPAFEPPTWKVLLGKAVYRIWPTLSLANELDPAGLSRDEQVVADYLKDEWVHGLITAKFVEVLAGGLWANHEAARVTCPVLLMHGDQDPITSVSASKSFAAVAPNCHLKLWPGLRHELHNEPEQNEVLALAAAWLGETLAVAPVVDAFSPSAETKAVG